MRLSRCLLATVTAGAVLGCTGAVMEGAPDDPASPPDGVPAARAPATPGAPAPGGGAGGAAGTPAPGVPNTPPGAPPAVPACTSPAPNVPFVPLRRLTRDQYVNTVRDLLGAKMSPDALAPDEAVGPFRTNLVGTVTGLVGQQYVEAAESLARGAASKLETLVACNRATAGDAACADQFIDRFGLRAYRRPLTAEEKARYEALYGTYAGQGGYANGLRVVVQTMLQSPHLLYHVELGPATGGPVVPLEPYALASRLSYFVWQSMPDESLFAAAGAGQISTPAGIRAQVTRMMKDARARDALTSFHVQWLDLGEVGAVFKDAKHYPTFTAGLRAAMAAETGAFVSQVFARDGRLQTLLGAGFTASTDAALLRHYGAAAGPAADGTVALPAAQRAGLLTQGAFLTAHASPHGSSPVKRGVVVLENLLCVERPDPPPDVDATPPAPSKTATTRERFAEHEKNPACAGCHRPIDNVGLGFESYDGIGAWRDVENGKPVDASGVMLMGGADLQGPFVGAVQLSGKLAASPDVQLCVAKQWLRFALGRAETAADGCSVKGAYDAFVAGRQDLRELVAAIATSDAFRHRRAAQ